MKRMNCTYRAWGTKIVTGIVLLDKPNGMSSYKATRLVQRSLQAEKAGHAGSLDPLATGLLPVFLGKATKLVRHLVDATKQYAVVAHLGIVTTTADSEGEVLMQHDVPATLTLADITAILQQHFSGTISQLPPAYSAVKYHGMPLYRLARQGKSINLELFRRFVTIYKIDELIWQAPYLSVRITCSKGTYIRSLVQDLGEHIGCGAHVCSLRRLAVGPYTVEQSITVEELQVPAITASKLVTPEQFCHAVAYL
jgi:tRNA pseudouridine55 synthase